MATKVHCKTFMPEHCTAGEVNVDGAGGWPVYYQDRALGMPFCNGLASIVIGCPGYEKEVLKQTMLKHDAIFRTQVYELHRLYRIQRELTEDLRRKDFCSYTTNLQASQSSTTSKWNSLKSPGLPVASSSFSRPSSASIYNSQKNMKCLGAEAEFSPAPSENSFWYNSDGLNAESRRPNAGVIDLRLPGDAYLDAENIKGWDSKSFTRKLCQAEDNSDVNCNIKSEKYTMLSLGSSESGDSLGCQKLPSVFHDSKKSHSLSDLNTHINTSSTSPLYQESPEHRLDLFNQGRTPSQVIQFEQRFPSFLEMDGGVKRQKLWFSNHESGNESGADQTHGETAKKFAEYEHLKPMKTPESFPFPLSNQSPLEACFKEKSRLNGTGKSLPANSICTVLTMPQITSALPSNPNCGNVNMTFQWAPSFKDLVSGADNVPVSDGQSTCFWSSSINKCKFDDMSNQKPISDRNMQKFDFSFSHSTGYHDSVPSEKKSSSEVYLPISSCGKQDETINLPHRPTNNKDQLPSMGLHGSLGNSVKDIDLNLALPGDITDTFGQHVVNKPDAREPASGMSRIRLQSDSFGDCPVDLGNDSQTALVFTEGYPATIPANNMRLRDLKTEKEGISFSPDGAGSQKKEMSCVPGYEKIFGVSVLDSNLSGATDLHPSESSSKMNSRDLHSQLSEELVFSISDKSSVTGGRIAINLNSVDSFTDLNCTPDSPKNLNAEEKVTMGSHGSDIAGKTRFVIDLELPAETFSEEHAFYTVEAPQGQLPAPGTVATNTKESKIQEYGITMAAETIINMSSIICEHPLPGRVTSLPLDQISADCLHWFADVVSSHMGASDSTGVQSSGEADNREGWNHDALDFYEAMTLNLVETKVDDLFPILDKENRDEDTSSISPCLLTKARRGQARKRRQRRDFQKDVLPGLASLSRHEVSEDIQTIGGMMRAVGQTWQSGVGRRNTGRNAGGGQARGRRRQRGGGACGAASTAAVVEEVPVESPPRKTNFADFEIDARKIMGWGRTRRCRRPRCPPGISVPPALS